MAEHHGIHDDAAGEPENPHAEHEQPEADVEEHGEEGGPGDAAHDAPDAPERSRTLVLGGFAGVNLAILLVAGVAKRRKGARR